jgi:uncharacterized coiled-coil protein SlyX
MKSPWGVQMNIDVASDILALERRIVALEKWKECRFDEIEERIAALEDRFDKTAIEFANRIAALEDHVETIDAKLESLILKTTSTEWGRKIEERIDALEMKVANEWAAAIVMKDFEGRIAELEGREA